MAKFNLSFCDHYNYPREIKAQLAEIVDIFSSYRNIISVNLTGSTSRGELSYMFTDGRLNIFSDYEFLVITRHRFDKDTLINLKHKLRLLEKRFSSGNPLFHIDFCYTTINRISRFPKILRQYEFNRTAKAIYCDNLIPFFPEVNLKNMDFRNLNEIIFKRLWNILKFVPANLLNGELTEREKTIFNYVLSRNALDISTIYLPYKGVLLPAYSERIHYINDHYQTLNAAGDFDKEFPDFLRSALEGKLSLNFNLQPHEMYRKTIGYFSCLIMMIQKHFSNSGCHQEKSGSNYEQLFNEWPVDRHELRTLITLLYRIAMTRGAGHMSQWLFLKKKAVMTSLLFDIHLLLQLHINGSDQYDDYLNSCRQKLYMLQVFNDRKSQDLVYPESWFRLKDNFSGFWSVYMLGNPA